MKYTQITDEVKIRIIGNQWNYYKFSDLSFWICASLWGCSDMAAVFTGKKATRKTWDETELWKQQWLVNRLVMEDSESSGLSKKNRERLYILTRKACVKHLTKELNKLKLKPERKARIKALIVRMSRIGLSAILYGSSPAERLEAQLWNEHSGYYATGTDKKVNNLINQMNHFLTDFEMIQSVLLNGTKIVAFVRMAMENVGLRPNAAATYEAKGLGDDTYPLAA